MSIDPKVELWLKLALTVLNLFANGSISLAGLVTPQTATSIGLACQLLITLLGGLMTAYSSSQPGPLAPPDSDVVKAAHQLTDAKSVADVVSAKSTLSAELAKS